jgi:hypothetical protein
MLSGFFRGNHPAAFDFTSLSYVLSTGSKVALPPSLCGVLWPVSFEDAPTSGSPTNNIIFLKLILFGKQFQLRLLNG